MTTVFILGRKWPLERASTGWYVYNTDQTQSIKIAGSRLIESAAKSRAKAWLNNNAKDMGWLT